MLPNLGSRSPSCLRVSLGKGNRMRVGVVACTVEYTSPSPSAGRTTQPADHLEPEIPENLALCCGRLDGSTMVLLHARASNPEVTCRDYQERSDGLRYSGIDLPKNRAEPSFEGQEFRAAIMLWIEEMKSAGCMWSFKQLPKWCSHELLSLLGHSTK